VVAVRVDDVEDAVRSTDELEAEVCTLAGQLAATTCRWLLLIAELDRREAYRAWGCPSMAHWLSWRCGLGIVAARQHVRVARALERFPMITAQFGAGRLSFSKVRALVRIATPASEAKLVEFAELTTASQLERTVREYERVCVNADDARAQLRVRRYTTFDEDDGTVTTIIRQPRDAAETLHAALDAAMTEIPVDPEDDSAEARRVDALLHLAQTYLAGGAARPPTEVVVHVDAEHLADSDRSPVLERITCDASLRVVTDHAAGTLGTGRRTRTVPRALRRRLARRDRGGCRFPGCPHRRFLHVHHMVHFAAGGATDADNCVMLCTFHHRLVHEGGWRIVGDSAQARELVFVSPTGRIVDERDPVASSPPTPPLRRDRRIDAHTIATAEGGRLDLDAAILGLVSLLRPDRS
jgi:hypothetical protein